MEMEHTTTIRISTIMGIGLITKKMEMGFSHLEEGRIMANGQGIELLEGVISRLKMELSLREDFRIINLFRGLSNIPMETNTMELCSETGEMEKSAPTSTTDKK